jgi:hypothetical protein
MDTDMIVIDTGMFLIDTDIINYSSNEKIMSKGGISKMNNPYIGKERRSTERRIDASERRELVRYEINKSPRRSGKDRRKVNGWGELTQYQLM